MTFYTDGVTESKMSNGKMLSEEIIWDLVREYSHLPAQEMADTIVARLIEMTQSSERDDMAVICARKT